MNKHMLCLLTASCLVHAVGTTGHADEPEMRPRVDELGIRIGILRAGQKNAITDVAGVLVGHETLIEGDDIRTGVTVVVPHSGDMFREKVPAAIAVGNGYGKLVGTTQVNELGTLETPIGLTNTLSTFAVAEAIARYTLAQPGNGKVRSVNPVVGECNDGSLNDIRAYRVNASHVERALAAARNGEVAEGSVGAGTGTRCMGWKGGIGTSSRIVPEEQGGYIVGVLAQTNFGGILSIGSAPVGLELGRYYLQESVEKESEQDRGSCVLVVATDAPMDARQLRRLASRALLGLASVGSPMTHGSGDYAIAFSAHESVRVRYNAEQPVTRFPRLADENLSPLFLAAKEATEEAVVNSLLKATTISGFAGNTVEAIPIDRVREICQKYNAIKTD